MSVSEVGRIFNGPSKTFSVSKSSFTLDKPSKSDEAIAEFRRESKKTPIDRIKENILKRHNLSQEQFDALPPEKRAVIQHEIEEAVKRSFKGTASGNAAAGMNANLLA